MCLWLGSMHTKVLLSRLVKSIMFGCLYSVTDSTVLLCVSVLRADPCFTVIQNWSWEKKIFCNMGKLYNQVVKCSGRVGKNTLNARPVLRGEERRLPKHFPWSECCFSPTTCAGGGEVLAPALRELCQWPKRSQDWTLFGVMGSCVLTELVCQSQARLDNSLLCRHLISWLVYVATEVGHVNVASCKSLFPSEVSEIGAVP